MQNPLLNRKHIFEYFRYGLLGASVYIVFVILFLSTRKYENLYLIYIGNFIFMAVFGFYVYKLIDRPFEGKRSVSMLIAGHLAIFAGLSIAVIMVIISVMASSPALFSTVPMDRLMHDAPGSIQINNTASLLFMIITNTILVNLGAGSLMVVLISYAAKRDQTKDKPVSLETTVLPVNK